MKKIIGLLRNNPAYLAFTKGKSEIVVSHASDEALLIASAFFASPKTMLVIKDNQYQASLLYQELKPLLKNNVLYFPSDESLRIEALAYSKEILGERIATLASLCENKPYVIICHTQSFVRYIPNQNLFKERTIHLHVGDIIDPLELRRKIIENGYTNIQRVDEPFYYSKRGGVIDVYSIQYEHPVRIEFFDDEIESIRFYDKDNQRSLNSVKEVKLLPATDMLYSADEVNDVINKIEELKENSDCKDYLGELEEEISIDIESLKNHDYSPRMYQYMNLFTTSTTLLSYIHNPKIITSSHESILSTYKQYVEETFFYAHELQSLGKMVKGLSLYKEISALLKNISVNFVEFRTDDKQISFITREVQLPLSNEQQLISHLKDYLVQNKVMICLENKHQIQLMIELLHAKVLKKLF